MRHGERDGGSAVLVLVWGVAKGMRSMGVAVPEGAHGPDPSPDLPEASFDGVCGPHLLPCIGRRVSEADGEVVAQASDSLRVGTDPSVTTVRLPAPVLQPFTSFSSSYRGRAWCSANFGGKALPII